MDTLSKTDYAILGMLSITSMSGYEIRQMIQQSTANFWSESYGQLYPALAKLVKLGLINFKLAQEKQAQSKKIYQLNPSGSKELKQWLALEPTKSIIRNELLLKLFFGANVSSQVNLDHVQHEADQTAARLQEFKLARTRLIKTHPDSPHLEYWLMTLQYGYDLAAAKLKWCKNFIKKLEKKI